MREFKFRSWNANEKLMITPFAWVNDSNLISTKMVSSPSEPLMQYTGIRDRNGTDIYERDIVSVFEDGVFIFNHLVDFDDSATGYSIEVRHSDYDLTTLAWAQQSHYYEYEIIGNYYENPDLLP